MKKVNIGNVPKMLVPLFESGTIVFCRDFPEWQRLHQKLGVDVHDSDANGASHTMSSENGVLHVIGVFNGKLSTIAHECALTWHSISAQGSVLMLNQEEPTRLTAT
ncbi:TPA: hypothetical protein ACNR26_003897 [Escherichia coli]